MRTCTDMKETSLEASEIDEKSLIIDIQCNRRTIGKNIQKRCYFSPQAIFTKGTATKSMFFKAHRTFYRSKIQKANI